MTRILTCFFFIVFAIQAYAQEKSSKSDTLLLEESRMEQIERLRSLLIDAIIDEDIEKIAKLENALKEKNNKNYLSLYLYEEIALKYLFNGYDEILSYILYLDTAKQNFQNIIRPRPDNLGQVLQSKMLAKSHVTQSTINNSTLEEEEKKILIINHILWLGKADTTMSQDSLNTVSIDFIEKYPSSKYGNYVKKNALFVYQASNWGLGFDFFSGYGVFDGKLGEYFGGVVPIGVAFDIQYKSLILYLRDYIGFSKTKKDIPFEEDVWKKNETSLVFLPEATLGLEVLNSKKFKIAPFAGISSLDLGPTLNNSESEDYDKIDLDFTSAPCLGINLDIKLKPIYNFVSIRREESSYSLLKIRYSYHKPNYPDRFSGGLHTIVIGYGGFGRSMKLKEF